MAPRLPYVSNDITGEIPDKIRARREGGQLLELDRTLLHNPAIAEGWNSLLGAIRTKSVLEPEERELAICFVAVLNGAEYEWTQHAPLAIDAGIPSHVMDELKQGRTSQFHGRQDLVLRFTQAMTRDITVSDELFQEAVSVFGQDGVHDLVATVATYNMVSRYLVALRVGQ